MNDDDQELAGRLATLESWEPTGDVDAAWSRVVDRVGRRSRLRWVGVGATTVCVVFLAVLFTRSTGDEAIVVSDPDRDVTTADELSQVPGETIGEPVDVSVLTEPGSHDLGSWPLTSRQDSAVAWTGQEFFVWGGMHEQVQFGLPTVVFEDGAVFDMAAGQWVRISDAPFSSGLYQPIAVWDGTDVIVVGLQCGDSFPPVIPTRYPEVCPDGPVAAAWNPRTNTWKEIPPPPFAPMGWVASTGDGASFVSADSPAGRVAVWDGGSGTWSQRSGPVPGDGGGGQMQAVECSGDSGARIVSVEPSGTDPVNATWVRSLDAGTGVWGAPVEFGHQVDHPVLCNGAVAVVEVAVTEDDASRGKTPPGIPQEVFDLLRDSEVVVVDLSTGVVTRIDDGSTFGYTRAIGDWVIVDRVDESTLGEVLSPDAADVSGDPAAPLPDTRPYIARIGGRAGTGAQPNLEPAPTEAGEELLATVSSGVSAVWTGEMQLREWLPQRSGVASEAPIDQRFVAWVPPKDR